MQTSFEHPNIRKLSFGQCLATPLRCLRVPEQGVGKDDVGARAGSDLLQALRIKSRSTSRRAGLISTQFTFTLYDKAGQIELDGTVEGIEFMQNYYREAQPRAGDMYTAMPWMQSSDLHMTNGSNADVLLNLAVRFMIQPPADSVPRTRPVAPCVLFCDCDGLIINPRRKSQYGGSTLAPSLPVPHAPTAPLASTWRPARRPAWSS